MSFFSIRCPNCAGSEMILVGDNQYKCKYCDNTFNYVNQSTSKKSKMEENSPQQIADKLSDKEITDLATKTFSQINETLEAIGFDANKNEVFKVPISELVSKLSIQSGIKYLIFDGRVTQRLVDKAKQAGINCIIGQKIADLKNHNGISLRTFTELGVT